MQFSRTGCAVVWRALMARGALGASVCDAETAASWMVRALGFARMERSTRPRRGRRWGGRRLTSGPAVQHHATAERGDASLVGARALVAQGLDVRIGHSFGERVGVLA